MKNLPITSLFEPRSVAVIGASSNRQKIGFSILNNIVSGGYTGNIYPVNPGGNEILGHRVYPSMHDISDPIDVAVIAVPASLVTEAVSSCAEKGVRYIQVISSGFSEVGKVEQEREIVRIAHTGGARILGPNMFGMYSSTASLNTTFSAGNIRPGNVAILTQSGALGIAMIGKTAVENMGLSAIVSLGNKSDIDESDLLEYLLDHEQTRVILLYIEGVKKGESFIEALKKTTKKKPVIVIKSGRSTRGAMAAASHTGSLAGSDEIFDAIIKQCGVMRAESLEEAFNWCAFLAYNPLPGESKSVIITNGGGVGVMATDACEKYHISLYDDQRTLSDIFSSVTPSYGSTKNPIDITGGATSRDYHNALNAPITSVAIDSTIALYCETATFDSENLVNMITDTHKNYIEKGKPITYALVGGDMVNTAISTLRKQNLPVYSDVYDAVACMGVAYRYSHYLNERTEKTDFADIDTERINRIIDRAINDNRTFLLADEGIAIMESAGISVPRSRIAKTIDQALRFADELGYPLVMKIVSRDIIHKSDAGGVALDLLNPDEIMDAFEAIMQNAKSYKPDAVIDGIEVSEMVTSGTELIVGARLDPSFGPIVMCGLGGIYVEIMKDVVFRSIPLNRKEITAMLKEIRSFPLLLGVRGEKRKDIDAIIDTIIKIGTVIDKCRRITDIEINPVVVYEQGKGLKAVDARILIANQKEGQ